MGLTVLVLISVKVLTCLQLFLLWFFFYFFGDCILHLNFRLLSILDMKWRILLNFYNHYFVLFYKLIAMLVLSFSYNTIKKKMKTFGILSNYTYSLTNNHCYKSKLFCLITLQNVQKVRCRFWLRHVILSIVSGIKFILLSAMDRLHWWLKHSHVSVA